MATTPARAGHASSNADPPGEDRALSYNPTFGEALSKLAAQLEGDDAKLVIAAAEAICSSDTSTGFAQGWAAAIQRISDEWIQVPDRSHFSIYLARLWWAAADPECPACQGKGVTRTPPPVRACVPVWGLTRCRHCKGRFNALMPYHEHLNPHKTHPKDFSAK